MLVVHSICAVFAISTMVILWSHTSSMLAATNALEATPEGHLRDAEAILLDVVDNCKESVAVLSLPELTFVRGNTSTSLYFGDSYLNTNLLDFVFEDDHPILLNCISNMLKKEKMKSVNYGTAADQDEGNNTVHQWETTSSRQTIELSSPQKSRAEAKEDLEEGHPLLSTAPSTSTCGSISIQYRVHGPHNELEWLESTLLLYKEGENEDTTIKMLMLLTRNISIKKNEEELTERGNAAKLQYITCCAHDLKTPLQSFSSALDLLMSSGLNAQQKDICKQAEVSLSLMSLTISQTMDTSKVIMVRCTHCKYIHGIIIHLRFDLTDNSCVV